MPWGVLLAVGQGDPGYATADEALPADLVEELKNRYVGEHFSLEGESVAVSVLRTGQPARMDSYDNASGSIAARFRSLGIRAAVGVPIILDGHLWGGHRRHLAARPSATRHRDAGRGFRRFGRDRGDRGTG